HYHIWWISILWWFPHYQNWWTNNPNKCGHPIDIVHCSPESLNSSDPPASASQQLGLQAHATAPDESCEHLRCSSI
uniref:Uncharacterized protein n=1 Tax=Sinocyclocheilus anshuiensis TaxID=1608454 RepID=A0A671Q8A2_9TELE